MVREKLKKKQNKGSVESSVHSPANCKGTGNGIVENGQEVETEASTSKRSKAGSISKSMSPKTNQGKKSS